MPEYISHSSRYPENDFLCRTYSLQIEYGGNVEDSSTWTQHGES